MPPRVFAEEKTEEKGDAPPPLPDSVLQRLKNPKAIPKAEGVVSDVTTIKAAVPPPKEVPKPVANAEPPPELPPPTKTAVIETPKPAASPEEKPPLPKIPDFAPTKPAASLPSLAAITSDAPVKPVEAPPLPALPKPVTSPLAAPDISKLGDPVVAPSRALPDVDVSGTPEDQKPIEKTEEQPAVPPREEKPEEKPRVVASLPKAPSIPSEPTIVKQEVIAEDTGEGKQLRVNFEKNKTDLGEEAKTSLNDIAEEVKKSQRQVRVIAYASGSAEESSVAKRTSLSRGLQIRAFLIAKGVNPLSITVQAMGNKTNQDDAEVLVR